MMEGMILAAGAGTRLRPLTNRIPKALVEVGGRPILASVIERLVHAGVSRIIINTHHRHFSYVGMTIQHIFDINGVDILPFNNYHVFFPAQDK